VYDPLNFDPQQPPVAVHTLRDACEGWVTVPEHHAALWSSTLKVEERSLAVYEEVSKWNL
jgi:hypothetical protein